MTIGQGIGTLQIVCVQYHTCFARSPVQQRTVHKLLVTLQTDYRQIAHTRLCFDFKPIHVGPNLDFKICTFINLAHVYLIQIYNYEKYLFETMGHLNQNKYDRLFFMQVKYISSKQLQTTLKMDRQKFFFLMHKQRGSEKIIYAVV